MAKRHYSATDFKHILRLASLIAGRTACVLVSEPYHISIRPARDGIMKAKTNTPLAMARTHYGTAHPEQVKNALWERAMDENWSGYALRQQLGIELGSKHFRQDFSHSDHRDTTPGPFWSWQRYGRTSTPLPDGRIIHIAGEHEDAYDTDFCIYNDIVVE